jgi:magnesium-transporting ATPase (P-type)
MHSLVDLATRLNIYKPNDLSISGEDLDHMSAADLHHAISQASIFYRVSPKHKLIIVQVRVISHGEKKGEQMFGLIV